MTNKEARKLLEIIYGEGCFMERADIRKITDEQEQYYKKKISGYISLDRSITYHHLKHKCKGGKTTIANGANLARYNHDWLHNQSESIQKEITDLLEDFKYRIEVASMQLTESGILVQNLNMSEITSQLETIKVYNNSELSQKEYNRLMYLRKNKLLLEDDYYER